MDNFRLNLCIVGSERRTDTFEIHSPLTEIIGGNFEARMSAMVFNCEPRLDEFGYSASAGVDFPPLKHIMNKMLVAPWRSSNRS